MVKKEEAVVTAVALPQLGTRMCLDGWTTQGKAMSQPWKNSGQIGRQAVEKEP